MRDAGCGMRIKARSGMSDAEWQNIYGGCDINYSGGMCEKQLDLLALSFFLCFLL